MHLPPTLLPRSCLACRTTDAPPADSSYVIDLRRADKAERIQILDKCAKDAASIAASASSRTLQWTVSAPACKLPTPALSGSASLAGSGSGSLSAAATASIAAPGSARLPSTTTAAAAAASSSFFYSLSASALDPVYASTGSSASQQLGIAPSSVLAITTDRADSIALAAAAAAAAAAAGSSTTSLAASAAAATASSGPSAAPNSSSAASVVPSPFVQGHESTANAMMCGNQMLDGFDQNDYNAADAMDNGDISPASLLHADGSPMQQQLNEDDFNTSSLSMPYDRGLFGESQSSLSSFYNPGEDMPGANNNNNNIVTPWDQHQPRQQTVSLRQLPDAFSLAPSSVRPSSAAPSSSLHYSSTSSYTPYGATQTQASASIGASVLNSSHASAMAAIPSRQSSQAADPAALQPSRPVVTSPTHHHNKNRRHSTSTHASSSAAASRSSTANTSGRPAATRLPTHAELMRTNPDFVHILSSRGIILYASDSASLSLFNYLPKELVGRNVSKFCHPGDLISLMRELKNAGVGERIETMLRMHTREGVYIWFEIVGHKYEMNNRKRTKCFILSGRERHMAHLSQAFLYKCISTSTLLLRVSGAGFILRVFPTMSDEASHPSDIEDRTSTSLLAYIPPADRPTLAQAMISGSTLAFASYEQPSSTSSSTASHTNPAATRINHSSPPVSLRLPCTILNPTMAPLLTDIAIHRSGPDELFVALTPASSFTHHDAAMSDNSADQDTTGTKSDDSQRSDAGSGSASHAKLHASKRQSITELLTGLVDLDIFAHVGPAQPDSLQFELNQLKMANKRLEDEIALALSGAPPAACGSSSVSSPVSMAGSSDAPSPT
ncbi:hypothetical protein BC831DRAFT_203939 [Entophlyctis helioformis]|nr:hypothetical protein BC831DRAFT_203939 [Entophlyctis helioformis]